MPGSCSSSGGQCAGCAPTIQLVGVSAGSVAIGDFGIACGDERYQMSTYRMKGGEMLHHWWGSTYNGGYSSNLTSTVKYGVDKYGNFYALTVSNGITTNILSFTSVGENDSYTLSYDGSSKTQETFNENGPCGPTVESDSSCETTSSYGYDLPTDCPCTGPYSHPCGPFGALKSTNSSCASSTTIWSSNELINPYGEDGYYESYTADTTLTETKSGPIDQEAVRLRLGEVSASTRLKIRKNNQDQDCEGTKCGEGKYACWAGAGIFVPSTSPLVNKLNLGVVVTKKLFETYASVGGDIKLHIPVPWDEESGNPEPNNCPCDPNYEGQMLGSFGFSVSSGSPTFDGSGDSLRVIGESTQITSSSYQNHAGESLYLSLCVDRVTML